MYTIQILYIKLLMIGDSGQTDCQLKLFTRMSQLSFPGFFLRGKDRSFILQVNKDLRTHFRCQGNDYLNMVLHSQPEYEVLASCAMVEPFLGRILYKTYKSCRSTVMVTVNPPF